MRPKTVIQTMVALAAVALVAAPSICLVRALGDVAAEQRRLAQLGGAHAAQKPVPGSVSVAMSGLLKSFQPLDHGELDSLAPEHPLLFRVPPEVDEWTREMRVPVTDEERSRWIPFEFDGITFYLVPLLS